MVSPDLLAQARDMTWQTLTQQLKREGRALLVLRGSSMEPTYRGGEVFHMAPPGPDNLYPGALILFRTGGEVHLHRLVKKAGSRFWQMGDAQGRMTPLHQDQLLGVAAALDVDGSPRSLTEGAARRKARAMARKLRARHLKTVILGRLRGLLGLSKGSGLLSRTKK